MKKYKYTFEEFVRAGGRASAKKRLEGMTQEQINEHMRKVRAGLKPKKERVDEKIEKEASRYPEGIE